MTGSYRLCLDMLESCNALEYLPNRLKEIKDNFEDVEWEVIRKLEEIEEGETAPGRKAITFSISGEWKGDEVEIILSLVVTADGDFDATTSLQISTMRELRDHPRVGESEELKQVYEVITSAMWVYDAEHDYPDSPTFEDCLSPYLVQAHVERACKEMKEALGLYFLNRDIPVSTHRYTTRHFNLRIA